MTTIPQHRSLTQDIAKGISICAMVLVHTWRGLVSVGVFDPNHPIDFIDKAGLLFGMPVFFLLAGYNTFSSLQRTTPRDFIIKRAKMIIPIYFAWSIIQGTTHYLKHEITASADAPNIIQSMLKIFYAPLDQFWFLYALMIFHIAVALLYKRPRVLIGVSVIAYLCNPFLPMVPHDICSSGIFYLIGYYIAQYKLPSEQKLRLNLALPLLAGAYVASAIIANVFDIDPRTPPLFVSTLLSVAFIMVLSHKIEHSKIGEGFAAMGRASLSIYVMHVLFFAGMRFVLFKLGVENGYAHLVIETLAGLFGPFIFYSVLKRYNLLRYAFLG